jgi:hypothetical protein
MPNQEEQYVAYMLRFRRDDATKPWRAMLANPHTGEQHNFAELEKLCQFLHERLAQLDRPETDEGQRQSTSVQGPTRWPAHKLSDGGETMSERILQINFKFNVPRGDYEGAVTPLAEPIAGVAGLQWKVWLMNEAESEAGGIMCFDDQASVQAYLEGSIVAQIVNHPALSDFSVKQFEVMGEQSAITRGPVRRRESA